MSPEQKVRAARMYLRIAASLLEDVLLEEAAPPREREYPHPEVRTLVRGIRATIDLLRELWP